MKATSVAENLVSCTMALASCKASGNAEWADRWAMRLTSLQANHLPSGSGVDNGTKVVAITETTIRMDCEFHHMNDQGSYDGWTQHRVTVYATFGGMTVHVSGRNRNEIKDYLADVYQDHLSTPVEWSEELQRWNRV